MTPDERAKALMERLHSIYAIPLPYLFRCHENDMLRETSKELRTARADAFEEAAQCVDVNSERRDLSDLIRALAEKERGS